MAFTFNKQHAEEIAAPPELLYEILTDYDSYAEWMPLIGKGHLMAREGDLAIAEFDLTSPQGAHVTVECIHTRNRMVMTRPIAGAAPFTRMQWDIEAAGGGKSHVTLSLRCTANIRWLTGAYANLPKLALRSLAAHVSAFAAEISIGGPDGEKLLELMETDEGLICWLNGKKYVMKEA